MLSPLRSLARHWQGQFSSLACGVVLVTFIGAFWFGWLRLPNLAALVENYPWQLFTMATLLAVAAAFVVWWTVGTWRSIGIAQREEGGTITVLITGRLLVLVVAILMTNQIGRAGWAVKDMVQGLIEAGDRYRIYADAARPGIVIFEGEIAWNSGRALAKYLRGPQTFRSLELNSRGGSIVEAEKIAILVETKQLSTHVREECISACTWVFISGRSRSAARNAKFGFHRLAASRLTSSATIGRLTLRYRNALLSHGVDVRFVDAALKVDPPDYWVPSARDLQLYGFVQYFD